MIPLWAPALDPPGVEVLRLILMLVITGEGGQLQKDRMGSKPGGREEPPHTAVPPDPGLRGGRQ